MTAKEGLCRYDTVKLLPGNKGDVYTWPMCWENSWCGKGKRKGLLFFLSARKCGLCRYWLELMNNNKEASKVEVENAGQ